MKALLNTLLFTTISLTTFSGCSLYQSEGRKLLEEQAFTFKNKGLTTAIVSQSANCIQSSATDFEFFESEHWIPIATGYEPYYYVYEDTTDELFTIVVAMKPQRQKNVFACEYDYATHDDMLREQKNDILKALNDISEMLN